jgi:hypothetical protein
MDIAMTVAAETVLRARGLTKTHRMGEVEVEALRGIDPKFYRGGPALRRADRRTRLELARQEQERTESLLRSNFVSEQVLDRALSELARRRSPVHAPQAGA